MSAVPAVEAPPRFSPDEPAFHAVLADLRRHAARRDAERDHPYEAVRELWRIGFGSARVPLPLGGAGLSLTALFALVEDIAAADPNVAQSLRNHFFFVESCLRPELVEERSRWLAAVVDGELFGGSFHEQGPTAAGLARFATTLTPVDGDPDGGFLLEGDKYYSTGNLYADRIAVGATLPDGSVASAIVPRHRDGVDVVDDWDGIGQRLTGSGTTRYRGVRVAADEVVPAVNGGPGGRSGRPHESTYAQLWLTTTIAGILRTIVDEAAALVRGRGRNYYHGLADHPRHEPAVLQTVGELAANAYAASAAVRVAAATLEEAWAPGPVDAARARAASLAAVRAKVVVDRLGQESASALFDAGGATAVRTSASLDRHWRNIRTLASHNPRSYKLRVLGDEVVNGTPPPDGTFF